MLGVRPHNRPVRTNCALTPFQASMFGRWSGFVTVSGKLDGLIGSRKIERAKSLATTPPILSAASSPANGVTAMLTGLKFAPAWT